MTNKEFQEILAQYPDDYTVQIDNAFGWEVPSNKYVETPELYIDTDFGFIEIEHSFYRDLWTEELPTKICNCVIIPKDINNQFFAIFKPEDNKFHVHYTNISFSPNEVARWIIIPEYE